MNPGERCCLTSNKEEAQILAELGLNLSQATIYLDLAKVKDATARDLCKITSIARQDVYQMLRGLEELGLVERILTKPLKFKATSIKNAISILSHRQENKNSELHTKALTLFSCSELWERTQESDLHEPSFELRNVYRNDPRAKAAIGNAKVSLRLLDKNMNWSVFYSFIDEWKQASKNGVKIQILNEFAKNRQNEPKFIDEFGKTDFQIRYAKILPAGSLLIFDDKELAIWEGSKPRQFARAPPLKALWSNHNGLIELATNYFESCWKAASP